MTVYRYLPDGGFAVGDQETGRTGYAFPSSTHATRAKRNPAKVAAQMIAAANAATSYMDPAITAAHDARNWAVMGYCNFAAEVQA